MNLTLLEQLQADASAQSTVILSLCAMLDPDQAEILGNLLEGFRLNAPKFAVGIEGRDAFISRYSDALMGYQNVLKPSNTALG